MDCNPRSILVVLKSLNIKNIEAFFVGGETGIRTPEGLASLTVFKTAAFNHSAISPII